MKYIADTIVDYIVREANNGAGVLKFVLPSYPASLLAMIGKQLEEQFARVVERRINFVYGIAYKLGKEWQEKGTDNDRALFAEIKQKGWYNSGNNLTNLRNLVKSPGDDCLVILLAGYDHIDDQASLRDFFHLDQEAVWELCLRRKFDRWVRSCLQPVLNLDDYDTDISNIAELFKNLYEYGLADLLVVSDYLEQLNVSSVNNGNDAYRLILNDMWLFKLPCMIGLTFSYARKKTFSKYIAPAREFINYAMFLDAPAREKANRRIKNYRAYIAESNESIDKEILGGFNSIDDLLNALDEYINKRSTTALDQLRKADFIYIYEKILGFKVRKGTSDRSIKPRKLTGLPPEIFLRAIWITLGEFKKEIGKHTKLVAEKISTITIQSTLFKHDFDTGADNNHQDDNKLARDFLIKVLGGIDDWFEDRIRELGDKHNPIVVNVKSSLCPGQAGDNLSYDKSRNAEPSLKFEVIIGAEGEKSVRREFLWVLPQNHQSRLLVDLYDWALKEYNNNGNALPAFAIPYLYEIFKACDEDEVNRLLATALMRQECSMQDLLNAPGIDSSSEINNLLLDLSISYQRFLSHFEQSGFFNALGHSYEYLRKAYNAVYLKFIENSGVSTLGPLLLKAFMLVSSKSLEDANWVWNEYLEAAIVTPLHPAMLEMLQHQHAYLCESFCIYAGEALVKPGDKVFAEKRWDRVVDLSSIKWPIYGTLKDQSRVLDTNVRSYNYIHLIGHCYDDASLVTSRLLLEYDVDEDEIPDAELFRESRTSLLIKNVLLDYRKLHAYADDGINIGAYCGKEIQPIIAGLDGFIATILQGRGERPYALKLTIFSDSRDDSSVMSWINAWKDRWRLAEMAPNKQYYSNCKISIAYRVVSRKDKAKQFIHLLRESDQDVMFFTDFIDSEASYFELIEGYLPGGVYRKFPVLEKTCCRVTGGGRDKYRERVISNHSFKLGALHAEVMAHIVNSYADPAGKHVVISRSNFQPWVELINTAHEHSAWVVCIDPVVDEQLMQRVDVNGVNTREIIGFGTGVGPHGENNYTISTEQFSLVDVKKKISSLVAALFDSWEQAVCDSVADSLVREAAHIAGLSVVKATGPSQYVRDFIAYAVVRKILPKDSGAFCDEIISLDAYRHWFDHAPDGKRPDLLRLRADIVDGYFVITAQIIECKLAQQWEGYLEKARQQIENGLKHLLTCFRPREDDNPVGIGDKPDQRYWWMQLHRLIASKGETNKPRYKETLLALERLSDGFFNITWQAAVVAIWTDLDNDSIRCSPDWDFTLDEQNMAIAVACAGRDFIRRVCLEGSIAEVFCGNSGISYVFNCSDCSTIMHDSGAIQLPQETTGEEVVQGDTANGDEEEKEVSLPVEEDVPGELAAGQANDNVIVTTRVPERILLGSTAAGGKDIYWEFGHPDLPNRHILVFGASGTGKTYTIQALLCELGKAGQNSLIVDYTNGFTNNQLENVTKEKLNPKQHVIRREPLAINPFRRQSEFIDDLQMDEEPSTTAQRVSGVFAEVYQLGDQQKSALYSAIRDGVAQEGNKFNLVRLIDRLERIRSAGGPSAQSASSVISKIQPFVDMNPFGEEDPDSWELLFNDTHARCHIIQLAGFMKDTSRLITEFSLIDLYWYYRARGNKDKPRVIVLDEIQNLDHRLDSPLGQFLTEGRKFGISLILATQTLSNLEKDEKDRLFQASHKLFFKPADTEIRSFAQILSDVTGGKTEEWVERLSSLKRGECFSLGYAFNEFSGKLEVNKWFKIRIKALEDRF
jgi:DNA phosphorothioation-dependent restriction protein DptH